MRFRRTFSPETIDLPDGRVLRKRRCLAHLMGGDCDGDGWIGADAMTVQVTTDDDGYGPGYLHFSVSYGRLRAPSAEDVRMVRTRLGELGADILVADPFVFVRPNIVQCIEAPRKHVLRVGFGLPGARPFDLGLGLGAAGVSI
jgi:hypothetical protein